MTRDEALELLAHQKPCFYTGDFKCFRNKRLYIKQVTKRALIVRPAPGTPNCDRTHLALFTDFITEEEWKSHGGRDRGYGHRD